MQDAEVTLHEGFLAPEEADCLMRVLTEEVAWRHDRIFLYGREHPLPRLQQWFADDGLVYTYSGIELVPPPWHPALLKLRAQIRASTQIDYNTVLANLYRDGQDAMGWHADDEPELGGAPLIASVTLGATRDFVLRHKVRRDLPKVTVALPHGSLLLMGGATQTHWEHALPRRKRVTEPRINLTFRKKAGRLGVGAP